MHQLCGVKGRESLEECGHPKGYSEESLIEPEADNATFVSLLRRNSVQSSLPRRGNQLCSLRDGGLVRVLVIRRIIHQAAGSHSKPS